MTWWRSAQISREARPAQIEVAIGQLEIFVAELRVELKRKIFGTIEDRKLRRQHFDIARGEFWIFRSRQTRRDLPVT